MTACVLMCVYNEKPALLLAAAESILQQSFRDFEFLIIDDGSTDPRTLAAEKHIAQQDCRVRVHCEPHRGLTSSLNRGLEFTEDEYVFRQDSDDWSDPRRLSEQVGFLDGHPDVDLLGTGYWLLRQDGTVLWPVQPPTVHEEILEALQVENPFCHGSVCIRRRALVATGGYRERFRCCQDYDLFWRIAEHSRVGNLPQALYHYRCTGKSVSATSADEQLRTRRIIKLLASARARGRQEYETSALALIANEFSDSDRNPLGTLQRGDCNVLAGDYCQAWRLYCRAIQRNPGSAVCWLKLLRMCIFACFPPTREWLFRPSRLSRCLSGRDTPGSNRKSGEPCLLPKPE
jgi:glycosyltransferase involved in cell wall biosynthesis